MTNGWRGHIVEVAFILGLMLLGLLVGGYIFAHQNVTAPSWVPVIGQKFFNIEARFTTAAGVMPGQGQSVTISGVNVGKVSGVRLDRGQAVVGMQLEDKYRRVYPDATMLLRPKTPLKDMTVELDPGSPRSGKPLPDGTVLSVAATQPDINFDEILARLDSDTQASLQMLLGDAGQALGGDGGRKLAAALKQFEPLSRNGKSASELLATRDTQLKRLITNLGKITGELGSNDAQVKQFVTASAKVFRRFAAQNANIGKTIQLLPSTLDSTNTALTKVGKLSVTLDQGLTKLEPATKNLAPSLQAIQGFSKATTPVLKNSIRPFARDAQPTAKKLVPVSRQVAAAAPALSGFTDVLNHFFNTLAYDPPGNGPGDQSFLFYLPWAGHNTNSSFSTQDAVGPLQRSILTVDCGALNLLQNVIPGRNAYLNTILQLLNLPLFSDPAGCNNSQTAK